MKQFFINIAKFLAVCAAAGLGLGLAFIIVMSIVAGWLVLIGAI